MTVEKAVSITRRKLVVLLAFCSITLAAVSLLTALFLDFSCSKCRKEGKAFMNDDQQKSATIVIAGAWLPACLPACLPTKRINRNCNHFDILLHE